MKNRTITVHGTEVGIATRREQDYISLTDMVRNFDGGGALIEQWLKNKDTVLFLGIWEQLNNPGFNSLEFEGIRNEAGRNSFFLSAKNGGKPPARLVLMQRLDDTATPTPTATSPSNSYPRSARISGSALSRNSN